MADETDYAPSPWDWVREQVETYERTGGKEATTLLDTGLPVVIFTHRGNKSGLVRKTPVMRVEHEGHYALVGSMGGAPRHPVWVFNLRTRPDEVRLQDGADVFPVTVRELEGAGRKTWWDRAVAAYPPYEEYQTRTTCVIPVFLASRRD